MNTKDIIALLERIEHKYSDSLSITEIEDIRKAKEELNHNQNPKSIVPKLLAFLGNMVASDLIKSIVEEVIKQFEDT